MERTSVSYNVGAITPPASMIPFPSRFFSSRLSVDSHAYFPRSRNASFKTRFLVFRSATPFSGSAFFGANGISFGRNKKAETGTLWAMNYDHGMNNMEDDSEEFLEVQVVDAVRMVPCLNRLYMTMSNGKEVEVTHVNPMVGRLLYEESTPTIFLKLKHSPELMLPICVGELAVGLLMKGFKREPGVRPNCYELLKNLVNIMKYEVRMVRVTQRVVDTYYARIYLSRPGDDSSNVVSVDARPSDAINLAVRCKAPIFVSKSIILSDSVRIATFDSDHNGGSSVCSGEKEVAKNVDVSTLDHDPLAEEMFLMKCMNLAAEEERYADAARLRDELTRLRSGFKGKINF